MRHFHFLMFALFILCASAPAGFAATSYDAPKGDAECYDAKGMAKPDTNCICVVQKYACGPASTCGAKVCQSATCSVDEDCKAKFGAASHCKAQLCVSR